jgi:hypothetical protein
MAASSEGMKGPRLEYVVRPLKGKVKTPHHSFNNKTRQIETTLVNDDAGYLVYMPNGHSYRLSKEQLLKRGYDRQPTILNFDQVNDTKTPAGRYKFAMDDAMRKRAWVELEEQVIKACVRRHGPVSPEVIKDDTASS